jgi:hypothetical protein
MPAEAIFQTPPPHYVLRGVRSTLLVASFRTVQEMGRETDYLRALPREHHAAIVDAVAGTWVGLEAALAHYEAFESLDLSTDAQVDVGRAIGQRIRETLFGAMLVGLSKSVGATPWTVIPTVPRLWPRIFDGSSIGIWKLGPKEARLDVEGMPVIDVRYFRNALRGHIMGMLDLFCTRTYVTSVNGQFAPGAHSLRVQWA